MDGLFDIVIPDQIPLWPPGPAWFVLAGLIVVGITFIVSWRYRKWQQNAYRRTAVRQLEQLEEIRSARGINELLKRVALVSYDRSVVAGLAGSEWMTFLRNTGGRFSDDDGALLLAGYRKAEVADVAALHLDSLVSAARSWIRHHHV